MTLTQTTHFKVNIPGVTCSCGENEDEDVLFFVKLVNHLLSVLNWSLAVQPHESMPTNFQISLENIQKHRELQHKDNNP